VRLAGDWIISAGLPSIDVITPQISADKNIRQIKFDFSQMAKWDSGMVSFLLEFIRESEGKKIQVIHQGIPEGAEKLLGLAFKVRGRPVIRTVPRQSFLVAVGEIVLNIKVATFSVLDFLGQVAVAFGRLFRGKAYFRRDEFLVVIQRCGFNALGLVSLISVLIGMILAFVGAIQLGMFGAQIYIADIVGIAMVRVMGAVMTGILMAGRTGASFAAELGIMQTNDEIDALKTMGISPVEFLVLPSILALAVMMPLLTLYADLMGILGGFIISVGMLDINPIEYFTHTHNAVKLSNLWIGLVHSFVFALIIAVTGCYKGIKSQRSAAGVGEATTSAVVSSITAIVIATAIITYLCQVLGV